MRASPIPKSWHDFPTWVPMCFRARPQILASSSPTTPKNRPRRSTSLVRSRIDPRNPGLKPELLAAYARTNIALNAAMHKAQCTPGAQRRITRWEHEDLLEAVQRRLDQDLP